MCSDRIRPPILKPLAHLSSVSVEQGRAVRSRNPVLGLGHRPRYRSRSVTEQSSVDSSQVSSGTSSAPPISTKAPSVFGSHTSSNTKAAGASKFSFGGPGKSGEKSKPSVGFGTSSSLSKPLVTEQSSLDSSQVSSGTSSAPPMSTKAPSVFGSHTSSNTKAAGASKFSFGGTGKSGENSKPSVGFGTSSSLSKPLVTEQSSVDSSQVTSGTSSAPPISTKAPSVFGSHTSSNTKATGASKVAHLNSVSVDQGRAVRSRNPVLGLGHRPRYRSRSVTEQSSVDSSQVSSGTSSAPPMSTKAPSVFGSHTSSNTKAAGASKFSFGGTGKCGEKSKACVVNFESGGCNNSVNKEGERSAEVVSHGDIKLEACLMTISSTVATVNVAENESNLEALGSSNSRATTSISATIMSTPERTAATRIFSGSPLKSADEYVKVVNEMRQSTPTWKSVNENNSNPSSTWKTVSGSDGKVTKEDVEGETEVCASEVHIEIKNAQFAWNSVCGAGVDELAVDESVLEELMTSLGATYEDEHRSAILSLTNRDDNVGADVLWRDTFVDWYVRWIFDVDEEDMSANRTHESPISPTLLSFSGSNVSPSTGFTSTKHDHTPQAIISETSLNMSSSSVSLPRSDSGSRSGSAKSSPERIYKRQT